VRAHHSGWIIRRVGLQSKNTKPGSTCQSLALWLSTTSLVVFLLYQDIVKPIQTNTDYNAVQNVNIQTRENYSHTSVTELADSKSQQEPSRSVQTVPSMGPSESLRDHRIGQHRQNRTGSKCGDDAHGRSRGIPQQQIAHRSRQCASHRDTTPAPKYVPGTAIGLFHSGSTRQPLREVRNKHRRNHSCADPTAPEQTR